jgi:ribosome maturation factor RimP
MDPQDVIERVHRLVGPVLLSGGLELVEVEYRREARGWVLRFYVDKEGGITLDDCAQISREIGRNLDVEDFITTPYILEVSSPGLTRSLKTEKDFMRYRDCLVKVRTNQPVENRRQFTGRLRGVAEEGIQIEVDGKVFLLPLSLIAKANLDIEF